MAEQKEQGLSVSQFVDKMFWVIIAMLANKISGEVTSINENIQSLNQKVAVVVATSANQDKRMDGLENRMEKMESGVTRPHISRH